MTLRFPRGREVQRHPTNVRHFGDERTGSERIADAVTSGVGSWPFIIVQSFLLMLWVVANGFFIHAWLGGRPFDPYPFILLNLVLSFQAAYTGPVVMMSQNRQAARDRDEAEHDYTVNREAYAALQRIEKAQSELRELIARESRRDAPPTGSPEVPG